MPRRTIRRLIAASLSVFCLGGCGRLSDPAVPESAAVATAQSNSAATQATIRATIQASATKATQVTAQPAATQAAGAQATSAPPPPPLPTAVPVAAEPTRARTNAAAPETPRQTPAPARGTTTRSATASTRLPITSPTATVLSGQDRPAATPTGSAALPLTIESVTNPAKVGQQLVVVARSRAGVPCSLNVRPHGGGAPIADIAKSTDEHGLVTWLWPIPATMTPQTATLTVHCGGQAKDVARFQTVRIN